MFYKDTNNKNKPLVNLILTVMCNIFYNWGLGGSMN